MQNLISDGSDAFLDKQWGNQEINRQQTPPTPQFRPKSRGGSVDPPSGPPSPKCRIDAIHVTGPPEKNRKSGPYFVDFTL